MSITPIPTRPFMGRSLVDHDPRNRKFPIRALLTPAPLREKVWRRGEAYDQGDNPWCVAYTAVGLLNTAPFSSAEPYFRRSRYRFADFYKGAQTYDEWPGEDYDGTSARGVLRYLREVGIVAEYRWIFGIDDLLATLSSHGPVSVGAMWKDGMWHPDPKTALVPYEGSDAGGHQFEAFGIHPEVEEVEFMNSWGPWGDRGRFRMKFAEVEKMLDNAADAHTLVKVA